MRKGTGKGRANAGRPGRAPSLRDNDAIEAMADVAAEVADTSEGLDGGDQASRSAGAMPDGLLQRRLNKTTAEKEKAIAEKAKAIKDMELVQKQLEEAKAELELAKTKVGGVVDSPITPSANKV